MPNEMQIALAAAGIILAANVLAMLLFVLFAKLPASSFRTAIQGIITELDKFADRMENSQKRAEAIRQVNEILGWRRILVPGALIGWVIDAEVAVIRRMQAATNCPDLHKEGEDNHA